MTSPDSSTPSVAGKASRSASAARAVDAPAVDAPEPSLDRLREGGQVTYDGQTWTVTAHDAFDHPTWPLAEWTLQHEDETLRLEHDTEHGQDVFRVAWPVAVADVEVDGAPFLQRGEASADASRLVSDDLPPNRDPETATPPAQITYQGRPFVLAERDARIEERDSFSRSLTERKIAGVCGGIAQQVGVHPGLVRGIVKVSALFLHVILAVIYILLLFVLPSPLPQSMSRYWVYRNGDDFVTLAYRPKGWCAHAGRDVSSAAFALVSRGTPSLKKRLRSVFGGTPSAERPADHGRMRAHAVNGTADADDRSVTDLAPDQLRTGDLVDYDLRTWTVTQHASVALDGWPADEWTLDANGDRRRLEHDGTGTFRLFQGGRITDVTVDGTPFLRAVPDEDDIDDTIRSNGVGAAPTTIDYRGDSYTLAEDDTRPTKGLVRTAHQSDRLVRSRKHRSLMGVFSGVAEYLGINPGLSLFRSILVRVVGVAVYVMLLPLVLAFTAPVLVTPIAALWSLFSPGLQAGDVVEIMFLSMALGALLSVPLWVPGYVAIGSMLPQAPQSYEERLSHYWMYARDDSLVVLECLGAGDWRVYEGEAVDAFEFDNILPQEQA